MWREFDWKSYSKRCAHSAAIRRWSGDRDRPGRLSANATWAGSHDDGVEPWTFVGTEDVIAGLPRSARDGWTPRHVARAEELA